LPEIDQPRRWSTVRVHIVRPCEHERRSSLRTAGASGAGATKPATFDPAFGEDNLDDIPAEQIATQLEQWLAGSLLTAYRVEEVTARTLVTQGWVLPYSLALMFPKAWQPLFSRLTVLKVSQEVLPVELEFRAGDGAHQGELRSLYEWLRRADDLRKSSVHMVSEPVRSGVMGADVSHLLVQLGPLEVTVLGAVVTAWLRTRGVDLDVERSKDGIKVSIRRARKGATAELGEQLFTLLREVDANDGAHPAGSTGGESGDD